MKVVRSTAIVVLFISVFLPLSGLWITDTKTISESQLSNIRNASLNIAYDNLIYKLWSEYNSTVRLDSTNVSYNDRSFSNVFGLQARSLGTFIRAITDFPIGEPNPSTPIGNTVPEVRDYIYNFNWHDFKLAIYNPTGASYTGTNTSSWALGWGSLEPYDRGRELCYSLMYYALIVDLLYNGSTTVAEHAQMDSILVDLADLRNWAYDTFINHDPPAWQTLGWEDNDYLTQPVGFCIDFGPGVSMPEIGFQVNRVHLLSFIGYASLLLCDPINPDAVNSDHYFIQIKKEFSSDFQIPSGSGCYGLNDYLTTATGMYYSGVTYQNRMFYLGTLFFDALNRMGLANLYNDTNTWNCDVIKNIIRMGSI